MSDTLKQIATDFSQGLYTNDEASGKILERKVYLLSQPKSTVHDEGDLVEVLVGEEDGKMLVDVIEGEDHVLARIEIDKLCYDAFVELGIEQY